MRISARLMIMAILMVLWAGTAYSAAKIELLASVVSVEGTVETQKAGQTSWKPAKAGTLLSAGDAVRTKAGGNCVLKWSQGNIVKLIPFTSLKVEKMSANPNLGSENTSLQIWSGKMYAKAKPLNGAGSSFEVKTPTAVAAVRGTKFSVGMTSEEETNIECLSGAVAVRSITSPNEVLLMDKQSTSVKKNQQPAPPSKMNDSQLQQFDSIKEVAAPALDIIQPAGNMETDKSDITVSGRTEPGDSVSVNGKTAAADSSGAFSLVITLAPGDNNLTINSINKQGKAASASRTVKYLTADMIAQEKANNPAGNQGASGTQATSGNQGGGFTPDNGAASTLAGELTLSVSSPADGFVTRDSTVMVSGTVSPGGDLYINDAPAGSSQNGPLNFSQAVPIPMEGENVIKITAKNGNSTHSITKRIIKHSLPPMLTMIQPGGSQFTVGSGGCVLEGSLVRCDISGVTNPGVKLTINSLAFSLQSDGSFNGTVQLGFNDTSITITAEDEAGNRTTKVLTRAIDTNRVSYLTISVAPSSITADNVSTANITVTGQNLLKQPLDGIPVTVMASGGGRLSANSLVLRGGTGVIVFTAGTINMPVTFTATAGDASATTNLTLLPDVPPIRNK